MSSPIYLLFTLRYFKITRRPPISTLFPYTTLFRSPGADLPFMAKLVHTPSLLVTLFEDVPGFRQIYHDGRKDRKSTRLNSSHVSISYAVFCLKKKTILRAKCLFRWCSVLFCMSFTT